MAKGKVLIINTGGTIGMVHSERDNPLSPLIPANTWEEITGNHLVLKPDILGIECGYHHFKPLLDSSDINYANWQQMAQVIGQQYDDYKGFVILHGTDTMCYTASALSFMLENLNKPVIITGAQLPMVEARSDAVQNLVTSIQIAASDTFQYPLVPEVCIFFRDVLIRGNRSRKVSSSGYSGFSSPNYPPLARAGEHIEFNTRIIRHLPSPDQQFYANTFLDTHVMVIEIFPGFDPQILKNVFSSPAKEKDRIKALVLKTFGAGNTPSNEDFLSAIKFVTQQDTLVVDVTQCQQGMVELGLYAASSGLLNRGVITGVDMTPEAAVCKLMYLLGKGWPKEEVMRVMQLDIRGEQSLNVYNIDMKQAAKVDPDFRTSQMIPGDINFSGFKRASIRFQDVQTLSKSEGQALMRLKVFVNHPGANASTPDNDPRYANDVKSAIEPGAKTDLFCDVSTAVKRLVKPGQMVTLSIIAEPGQCISWEKMSLSIFTEVL